jgi:phage portal protein BeeE
MQQGAPSKGFRASLQRAYHFLKHPDQERAAGERASALNTQGKPAPRQTYTIASQQRSNRAAAADLFPFQEALGAGAGWARSELGAYYATSVSVYSAIKLWADAINRPAAQVYRQTSEGVRRPVGPDHPVQQLLEQVNRWHTRGDLWRATEIYLNLWGSAFWALERDEEGRREIWPLRPDRVSILPDRRQYIRGFVYQGRSGPVAYTPDEIV